MVAHEHLDSHVELAVRPDKWGVVSKYALLPYATGVPLEW